MLVCPTCRKTSAVPPGGVGRLRKSISSASITKALGMVMVGNLEDADNAAAAAERLSQQVQQVQQQQSRPALVHAHAQHSQHRHNTPPQAAQHRQQQQQRRPSGGASPAHLQPHPLASVPGTPPGARRGWSGPGLPPHMRRNSAPAGGSAGGTGAGTPQFGWRPSQQQQQQADAPSTPPGMRRGWNGPGLAPHLRKKRGLVNGAPPTPPDGNSPAASPSMPARLHHHPHHHQLAGPGPGPGPMDPSKIAAAIASRTPPMQRKSFVQHQQMVAASEDAQHGLQRKSMEPSLLNVNSKQPPVPAPRPAATVQQQMHQQVQQQRRLSSTSGGGGGSVSSQTESGLGSAHHPHQYALSPSHSHPHSHTHMETVNGKDGLNNDAEETCAECMEMHATTFCADCGCSFCGQCVHDVHSRRTFRSHEMTQLSSHVRGRESPGVALGGGGGGSAQSSRRSSLGGDFAPDVEGLMEMSFSPDLTFYHDMNDRSVATDGGQAQPGSLRACSRELRKLRDDWKTEQESLDAVLSILNTEADATYQEVQGHFKQLQAALKVREEIVMGDLKQRHAQRCAPLHEHTQLVDSFTSESKRIIRLARGDAAKEPSVEAKVLSLIQSEFDRQKAIRSSTSLSTMLATATAAQFRFSTGPLELSAILKEYGSVEM